MPGTLMSAEMAQQPAVLAQIIARAADDAATVRKVTPDPLAGIVLLARGSSDNAAVFGRYLAELVIGRPAGLAAPSLYTRYHAEVNWEGYLVIALSQSGATPEILTTAAQMRASGATVAGITNEPESPMRDTVDVLLSTDAGPERAVPATKTMTAQMLLLATALGVTGMDGLPGAVTEILQEDVTPEIAEQWRDIDRLIVTGRGLAYAAALEIALKIKETTGILAEGFSTADLRHGPIATAFAGAPVLLVDAGGPAADDTRDLGETLKERNASVVMISEKENLPEPARAIGAVVRGQQLARALALAKGADPDQPVGLTKITPTT
ncbi:MAG: SIS domain-containing protein [Streptosporangiaceae bacterium]|jgi:glucosamine--fructose-6-phosphate aminotransferase (isomerizing)